MTRRAMHVERLDAGVTPEQIARRLGPAPGLAWLDGDDRFDAAGRYSFVASDPVEVRRRCGAEPDPLSAFADLGERHDEDLSEGPPASVLPRWIGAVAYDAAWAGETRTPPRIPRDPDASVLWLGRYDAVFAFDHHRGEAWLVGDDRGACGRARERLAAAAGPPPRAGVGQPVVDPPEEHLSAIGAALEHILAGDIYQVNLARRWVADFDGDPLALWLAMRRASPVPLGLFLRADDLAVLTRTMETFLRWDRRRARLESRPIKGTIARRGEDAGEAHALRSDDKERAEHAMIVDLVRNDLGRIAITGSVEVAEVMAVEPYAKLSHLVSTIACNTAPEATLEALLRATFPPGSVTGAPKVRAVEMIEALERWPRGIYTGCVGHVDRAGGAHFGVAIRTAQIAGGRVCYHAGGGLVSASVPAREVAETELKARVFLDAVAALRREA